MAGRCTVRRSSPSSTTTVSPSARSRPRRRSSVRPEASSTVRPTTQSRVAPKRKAAGAGGIGRHHAAERRARFGGVERQGELWGLRGQGGVQFTQGGAGQHADPGRIGLQVESDDAAQPSHRHEMRGRVGHGAASHAGARAAHGDPMRPIGVPAQHFPQFVHGAGLGHRGHGGGRHPRFVVKQIGRAGRVWREAHACGRGRDRPGQVARVENPVHGQ